MDLLCGHAICLECSQKLRIIFPFDDDEWPSVYQLRCPICRAENQYNEERFYANAFLDFLNELPRMEAQLKVVKWVKRRDSLLNFFKLRHFSILSSK
ncbi:unnamed protein product, partial [Mesorhabditis belari]|uniref:Uncharacterized protein n=1 Tax=Mesorhabditis belari TaxID=2138241 RepID=A0AAF3J738_9BILA